MERYCKVIDATIDSGASKSDAIGVSEFKHFAVELPDSTAYLASAAVTVYLEGCDTSDGTFYRLKSDDVANITSASSGDQIATVSQYIPSFAKVCVVNTATALTGYGCKIHCFY